MKLIAGLGNPGLRYKNTRHNIGFLVIDNFARKNKGRLAKEVALLKPQTFMNNSGKAVTAAINKFNTELKDLLIVCDDINLKLGIIRLRAKGSAGGHKGIKSIIEELDTDAFNRLRIGIGFSQGPGLTDYVLSKFKSGEKRILKGAIDMAGDAIDTWIHEGIDAAMNRFNIKNKTEVE